MKPDPIFFRYFREMPRCFFHLIGRPETDVRRYELNAIEYKETAVRLDGVFQPRDPEAGPAYIWETQQYSSDRVYANLTTKIGRFLEHGDPAQDWVAVVIYPSRSVEQKNIRPYRCLIESDQLLRIYLDELPPAKSDDFEMGILELIVSKPAVAKSKAIAMVPRINAAGQSRQFRETVVQFIEAVMVSQFPKMTREGIQKMLQVWDLSQTRVYQEAMEEGREEAREEAREKTREAVEQVALRLLKLGRPINEIAEATGLTPAKIRALKKKLAG